MRVSWSICVAVLLSAAAIHGYRALSSPSVEAVRQTRLAALSLASGNLSQARERVASALEDAPRHAPALLVRACLALEEENAAEAEEVLRRLEAASPRRMETRLLEHLLAHRRRTPAAGWRRSFLSAWAELGRPDFKDSPLLPAAEDTYEMPDIGVESWRSAPSAPARLVLALASPALTEEQSRWLLEQLPTLMDPVLLLAVSRKLQASLPATARREAARILRRRLESSVGAQPRSMQLRLRLLMADTDPDTVLGAQDLEELEGLAMLPLWRETSLHRTFLEVRGLLKQAGVPHAGERAFSVVLLSTSDRGLHVLSQRAAATRSQLTPGARQRLGRILWHIGSRVAEQPTVPERVTGLQMMRRGAEDMQDEEKQRHVDHRMDKVHAALAALRASALERWPLPSLREEVLEESSRDELATLEGFDGPGLPDSGELLKQQVLPFIPESCPPARLRPEPE